MKFRLLIPFVFFLFINSSITQETPIPKSELLEDLQQLQTQLQYIHPTLHFYPSTKDLPAVFNQLSATLPDSLNRIDFLKHISPILDSLKCGHTSFEIDRDKKQLGKKLKHLDGLFPLTLIKIENKYLIKYNLSGDTTNINSGDEILKINHFPISEIVETLTTLSIGADGNNKSGEIYFALKNFTLAYHMFYGEFSQFHLKTRDSGTGQIKEFYISGEPYSNIKPFQKRGITPRQSLPPFELRKIQGYEEIAILDINSFSNTKRDFAQLAYKIRLKKAFKEIRKSGYEYLIIDMRDNSGGSIKNMMMALQYVHIEPFVLIKEASYNPEFKKSEASCWHKILQRLRGKKSVEEDRIVINVITEKEIKNKRKNCFKGKVIVLMNAGTYSAGSGFALSMKTLDRAVLLGTTSAGSYYLVSGGNFHHLELENSGLIIRIPILRINYQVDPSKQDALNGVLPDVRVENNINDFVNGVDTQMNAALQLIIKYILQSKMKN